MPLPKIATPTYELELPSTGQTIQYRPFLVKEEKLLVIALESDDTKQITTAIKAVIKSCVLTKGIKVEQLPTFDIEYLFLKARAKSVGEKLEVQVTDPGDETYTTTHEIDVDKIQVQKNKDHKDFIKLDEDTAIKLRYPGIDFFVEGVSLASISERLDLAAQCVEQIVIGEEVYNREDMTTNEIQEWIEGLTSVQFTKVLEFFVTMPKLAHKFTLTNPKTKKKFSIELEGLSDFF